MRKSGITEISKIWISAEPSDTPVPLDRTTLLNLKDFVPCYPSSPIFTTVSRSDLEPLSRQHHLSNCEYGFGPEILFTPIYSACVALLIKQCLKSSLEGVGEQKGMDILQRTRRAWACPRIFQINPLTRQFYIWQKCKNLVQCQVARVVILFYIDVLGNRSS